MNILAKTQAQGIKKEFLDSPDIIIKDINLGEVNLSLIFIDGLCNIEEINRSILFSLSQFSKKDFTLEALQTKVITFCQAEIHTKEEAE